MVSRIFFISSIRRHTTCALVTGVQTCALPISLVLIVEATLLLHRQPEQIVSASWDFANVKGAVDTVIQTIQSGVAIARMELLDTSAMMACNRQSHLGLPECPTLFLEFHGSGQIGRAHV